MPQQNFTHAAGLYTDPSDPKAPAGSLRQALNCVINRAGIIEPRPGFRPTLAGDEGELNGFGVHAIWPFKAWRYLACKSLTGSSWKLHNVVTENDVTHPSLATFDARHLSMERVDDVLYFSTVDRTLRISSSDPDAALVAGLPRPNPPSITAQPDATEKWLQNDSAVAYRICFAEERDGRLFISPPSGRMVFRYYVDPADSAATTLRVNFPSDTYVREGMTVQIYRSDTFTPNTAAPDDELALVKDYQLTAADISAGFVTITDTATPLERGAALYTNETQGGALDENAAPPIARAWKLHNRMLFAGNTEAPYRIITKLTRRLRGLGSFPTGNPALGCDASSDFTITASSTTAVSDAYTTLTETDEITGMVISDSDEGPLDDTANFSADTRLDLNNGGAGTFILDKAALGTGSVASFLFDWIEIFYVRYWFTDCPGMHDPSRKLVYMGATVDECIENLAEAVGYNQDDCVLMPLGDGAFSLSAVGTDDDPIALRVDDNRLDYFSPPLSSGDNIPERESFPGRLIWSKLDQPESFPETQFVDLGDKERPIMALARTREVLFAFKEDGVFAITGDTPDQIRTRLVDSTLRLVHPDALVELENAIFAWTTRGVVRLTDGGAQEISDPQLRNELHSLAVSVADDETTTSGVFMTGSDRSRRLILGVSGGGVDQFSTAQYHYSTRTETWTKWEVPYLLRCGAAISEKLHFAGDDTADGLEVSETDDHNDAESFSFVSSVVSLGDSQYRLVFATDHNLTECSIVAATSGELGGPSWAGLVTGVEDATTVTVESSTEPAVGICRASHPFTCVLEWAGQDVGAPGISKHWRYLTHDFSELTNVGFIDSEFMTDRSVHSGSGTHMVRDTPPIADAPLSRRIAIPRATARGARLSTKVSICSAGRWALQALTWTLEAYAERVGRRGGR